MKLYSHEYINVTVYAKPKFRSYTNPVNPVEGSMKNLEE